MHAQAPKVPPDQTKQPKPRGAPGQAPRTPSQSAGPGFSEAQVEAALAGAEAARELRQARAEAARAAAHKRSAAGVFSAPFAARGAAMSSSAGRDLVNDRPARILSALEALYRQLYAAPAQDTEGAVTSALRALALIQLSATPYDVEKTASALEHWYGKRPAVTAGSPAVTAGSPARTRANPDDAVVAAMVRARFSPQAGKIKEIEDAPASDVERVVQRAGEALEQIRSGSAQDPSDIKKVVTALRSWYDKGQWPGLAAWEKKSAELASLIHRIEISDRGDAQTVHSSSEDILALIRENPGHVFPYQVRTFVSALLDWHNKTMQGVSALDEMQETRAAQETKWEEELGKTPEGGKRDKLKEIIEGKRGRLLKDEEEKRRKLRRGEETKREKLREVLQGLESAVGRTPEVSSLAEFAESLLPLPEEETPDFAALIGEISASAGEKSAEKGKNKANLDRASRALDLIREMEDPAARDAAAGLAAALNKWIEKKGTKSPGIKKFGPIAEELVPLLLQDSTGPGAAAAGLPPAARSAAPASVHAQALTAHMERSGAKIPGGSYHHAPKVPALPAAYKGASAPARNPKAEEMAKEFIQGTIQGKRAQEFQDLLSREPAQALPSLLIAVGDLIGDRQAKTIFTGLGPALTALLEKRPMDAVPGLLQAVGGLVPGAPGRVIGSLGTILTSLYQGKPLEALPHLLHAVASLMPDSTGTYVQAFASAFEVFTGKDPVKAVPALLNSIGGVITKSGGDASRKVGNLVMGLGKAFESLTQGKYVQAVTDILPAIGAMIGNVIGNIVTGSVTALADLYAGKSLKTVLPRLIPLIGDLIGHVTNKPELGRAIRGLEKEFANLLAGKGGIRPLLSRVLSVLGAALGGRIGEFLSRLATPLGRISRNNILGPVLDIIAAVAPLLGGDIGTIIGRLISGFRELTKPKNRDTRKALADFTEAAFAVASLAGDLATGGALKSVIDLNTLGRAFVKLITGNAQEALTEITSAFGSTIGTAARLFHDLIPALTTLLEGDWRSALRKALPAIGGALGALGGEATALAGKMIGTTLPVIVNLLTNPRRSITSLITAIGDLIEANAPGAGADAGKFITRFAPALDKLLHGTWEEAVPDALTAIKGSLHDQHAKEFVGKLAPAVGQLAKGNILQALPKTLPAIAAWTTGKTSKLITGLEPAAENLLQGKPSEALPAALKAIAAYIDPKAKPAAETLGTSLRHLIEHKTEKAFDTLLPGLAQLASALIGGTTGNLIETLTTPITRLLKNTTTPEQTIQTLLPHLRKLPGLVTQLTKELRQRQEEEATAHGINPA
ncbi:hypothetical protein ABZ667_42975, partial [Streptomyces lavendulae]|uniref:hypothetical protein n=1 Tax=Streptomyces lavendulae TaxID=1914 RepID=UPI0033D47ACF